MPSPKASRSPQVLPPVSPVPGDRGDRGELSSLAFAALARQLGDAGRRLGFEPPAFRSPPRVPGLRRSIRREADGSATVSVALRGRPAMAVVADMVEGMIAAAGLSGVDAGAARDDLWCAALCVVSEAPVPDVAPVVERNAA